QAGVGDHLQLEHDPAFLAWYPQLGFARSAVSGCGEGAIPAAALPAQSHSHLLIRGREIAKHVASIPVQDQGARWDSDDQIAAAPASAVASLPPGPVLSAPV